MLNVLSNLKIAHKLVVCFGLCVLLSTVNGIIALQRMSDLNKVSADILTNALNGVESLGDFQKEMSLYRCIAYRHITISTAFDKTNAEVDLARAESKADQDLNDYEARITSPDDRHNFDELKSLWTSYASDQATVLPVSRTGNEQAAGALINGPMRTEFWRLVDDSNNMVDWNHQLGKIYAAQAASVYTISCAVTVALILFSILLSILCAIVLTKYVTTSISELSGRLWILDTICVSNLGKAVAAMEQGDLTIQIETESIPLEVCSRDEFGQMATTFNAMLEKIQQTIFSFRTSQLALRSLVSQLQDSANQVNSAAINLVSTSSQFGATTEQISSTMDEIAQASEQSARGASEVARGSTAQAASMSEGFELVKELATSVSAVAQDSTTAKTAALEANEAAQKGANSVKETVSGMHGIQRTISTSSAAIQALGASSKQIGTIVRTIEEIADQTNLLALNAAIEAARAGEAGRGFAVVADEVRKLAERSRGATEEIGALIDTVQAQTAEAVSAMEGGVKEVSSNTEIAERAGSTLTLILSSVASVTERVQNICAATQQMTSAADNVTRSMSDVAAIVEESSAAAEEMSASADQVSASVSTVASTSGQQCAAIEELVSSASSLSDISCTLSELVARFKICSDDVTAIAGKKTESKTQSALQKAA
jgi:methyl-accepting chemotaxis protein